MTGKQLQALTIGEHKVRLKGIKFTLTKTAVSYPCYGYQYKIAQNIIIHIHPVYDTLLITTQQHGITFSRDLDYNDLIMH